MKTLAVNNLTNISIGRVVWSALKELKEKNKWTWDQLLTELFRHYVLTKLQDNNSNTSTHPVIADKVVSRFYEKVPRVFTYRADGRYPGYDSYMIIAHRFVNGAQHSTLYMLLKHVNDKLVIADVIFRFYAVPSEDDVKPLLREALRRACVLCNILHKKRNKPCNGICVDTNYAERLRLIKALLESSGVCTITLNIYNIDS